MAGKTPTVAQANAAAPSDQEGWPRISETTHEVDVSGRRITITDLHEAARASAAVYESMLTGKGYTVKISTRTRYFYLQGDEII